MYLSYLRLVLLFCFVLTLPSAAQNKPCPTDPTTGQFAGNPAFQSRCLLRPNGPRGVLDDPLEKLPRPLEGLIGQRVELEKGRLIKYLIRLNLTTTMIGGDLEDPLSVGSLPNGEEIQAPYFVIHDTSTPNYGIADFPSDINLPSWRYNNLEMWLDNPVAHVFVNRLGESITVTPFNEAVRKGWGTKFARDILKIDGKGLQIHIELCQPRRGNPNWFSGNDEIAPSVGFTDDQYKRLALLYISASVRRGTWLIPAYHSAIDAGIKDAHDDPQNFELKKFAESLQKLIQSL